MAIYPLYQRVKAENSDQPGAFAKRLTIRQPPASQRLSISPIITLFLHHIQCEKANSCFT
jgi:hypothetical protein